MFISHCIGFKLESTSTSRIYRYSPALHRPSWQAWTWLRTWSSAPWRGERTWGASWCGRGQRSAFSSTWTCPRRRAYSISSSENFTSLTLIQEIHCRRFKITNWGDLTVFHVVPVGFGLVLVWTFGFCRGDLLTSLRQHREYRDGPK